MATVAEIVQLHSGGPAHRAVYGALLRAGLREPQDFALADGPVDFVLRRRPRALAILTPERRQSGALAFKRAALAAEGVTVEIVGEQEALLDSQRVVSRLLEG